VKDMAIIFESSQVSSLSTSIPGQEGTADTTSINENFVPSHEDATSSHSQLYGQEESDMNALRYSITDALMIMYQ
jgi:hypothetical protein